MNIEIEAKFLGISIDAMRDRLTSAGAKCEIPMRPMRRVAIKAGWMYEDNGYLRLRDEGDRITMTYKRFDGNALDCASEVEITVNSFEAALELIKCLRLPVKSYQESRRETWTLGSAEIVIDEWPWIRPYIEIEGPSEDTVRAAAEKLGLDWSDAKFGSVMTAYEAEYPKVAENGRLISDLPEVKFNAPVPDILLG